MTGVCFLCESPCRLIRFGNERVCAYCVRAIADALIWLRRVPS